jgi:hypothetical protein
MVIGGKERPIAFTINALIELKKDHGVDILKGLDKEALGPEEIRAIAFVGLKYGAKSEGQIFQTPLEEIGDWLTIPIVSQLFKELTDQSSTEGGKGKPGE